MKTLCIVLLVLAAAVVVLSHQGFAQTQPPGGGPPQIEGFVPVDTLPPSEQLPAARLLIAAYAFVWVAVFFYLWSIWKRLGRVEGELQQLARRTTGTSR